MAVSVITSCVFILTVSGVFATPPFVPWRQENDIDGLYKMRMFAARSGATRTTFKYKYITNEGVIFITRPSGYSFEVAATAAVSESAHYKGALILTYVVRNMPSSIFNTLATSARCGIFSNREGMSVFPENAIYADTPQCAGSCSGSCAITCTTDGRKYDSLAGAGGDVTAILDDNILCNSLDPYRSTNNILVHEFAHTVHMYGVSSSTRSQIEAAYDNARRHNLWISTSYAMSTVYEYFAEGTGAFFNVNQMPTSSGGMNMCGGAYCTSEVYSRQTIEHGDPTLYNLLSYVYTGNNPDMSSGLMTCI